MSPLLIRQIVEGVQTANASGREPAFSYDRISNQVQLEGVSLEAQSKDSRRYAEEKNLHLVHVFDVVESASKGGRKNFNTMIDLALAHGVRHLIFKNTDRMSRNYEEWLRLLKEGVEPGKLVVHQYQSGKVIDQNADHNAHLVLNIELAVAKQLADKLSNDMKDVYRHKLERGHAFRKSWGYITDKERGLKIDPLLESDLRYFFDEFDGDPGYSVRSFMEQLNRKGIGSPTGGRWATPSQVHQILINPVYHGEFYSRKNDKLYSCLHEPFYDKSRYEERMRRLGVRHKAQRLKGGDLKKYALRGLLRCACGKVMSGDTKQVKAHGGERRPLVYYVHKCEHRISPQGRAGQVSLQESKILSTLDEYMETIRFSDDFVEAFQAMFGEAIRGEKVSRERDMAAITNRIRNLETKKENLVFQLAAGEIDDVSALNAGINRINAMIEEEEKARSAQRLQGDAFLKMLGGVIEVIRDTPAIFIQKETAEGKGRILEAMVESIQFREDGKLAGIRWLAPFNSLMGAMSEVRDELAEKRRESPELEESDGFKVRNRTAMLPR